MTLAEELKQIQRENRADRLARAAELAQMDEVVPYGYLSLRQVEARHAVAQLKGKSLIEQVEGVQQIPSHLISGPGVDNSEINAVLEFLDCPRRAGFAHGCSSPIWTQSSWGYWLSEEDVQHGLTRFHECRQPRTSIDGITFLLCLGGG